MPEKRIIKIALVDDHTLFRKGLASLIEVIGSNYQVLFEADNGKDMKKKINKNNLPHIILMDVNMPGMDGFESVEWLNKYYPKIKVLVISMVQREESIMHMLKLGVKGYLSKDVETMELSDALSTIMEKGYYYTDFITGTLVHSIQTGSIDENNKSVIWETMSSREKDFLSYCCTELTYHQIAEKMFLSNRTIEGYRNSLCEKLQIKSRVGLAMYAVKNGLVQL